MSVGDVSEVTPPADTTQTDATTQTMSTTISGGTVGSLPKPLIEAICQSIAYNICSSANNSNQRMHDILQEEEQEQH
jgi:hypothetical protein